MGQFSKTYRAFGRGGLSGLANVVLGSIRNKALDPSHHPFKRNEGTGKGPKNRELQLQSRWACSYMPPVKKRVKRGGKTKSVLHYRQRCMQLESDGSPRIATRGPRVGEPVTKIIARAKDTKTAYNAKYEAFLAKPERNRAPPHNNANSFRVNPNAYAYKGSDAPSVRMITATKWKAIWAKQAAAAKAAAKTKTTKKPAKKAAKKTAKRAAKKAA